MSVSNDTNHVPPVQVTAIDPHGEAALLLSESLIHSLLARDALSSGDALEVVQTAIDAQAETDHDRGLVAGQKSRALGLLLRIKATLNSDVDCADLETLPQI